MHYTYQTIKISRSRLFLKGILRPSIVALPSVLLLPLWWSFATPSFTLQTWLTLALGTVLFLWTAGVTRDERNHLIGLVRVRKKPLVSEG